MSDLQMALKAEYFNQIKTGVKTEEFRLITDYWKKRLINREYDRLILTLGYPKRTDSSKRIELPYLGYTTRTITHKHFGDQPVEVFAIRCDFGEAVKRSKI